MDFTQLLNQSPAAGQSSQAVSARSASPIQTKNEPGEFFAVFKNSLQQASHQRSRQATRTDKPPAFQAPDKRAGIQAESKLQASDHQTNQAEAPVQAQAPVADKPEPLTATQTATQIATQTATQAAVQSAGSQPLTACQNSRLHQQETDEEASAGLPEQTAPVAAALPAKISSAPLTELLFRQQLAGIGAPQERTEPQPDEKSPASAADVIANQIGEGAQADTTALEAVRAEDESDSAAGPAGPEQAAAARQTEQSAPSGAEQPTASQPAADSAAQAADDSDAQQKTDQDADAIAQAEAAAAMLASLAQTHGPSAAPAAPSVGTARTPVQAVSSSDQRAASEQAAVNEPTPAQVQPQDQQAQLQAEQQLRKAALQQPGRHQPGGQAIGSAQLGASAGGGMRLEGLQAMLKPDGEISRLPDKLVNTGAAEKAAQETEAAPIRSDSQGAGQANLAWQQNADTTYGTQGQRVDAPHAASAAAATTAPAELAEKFQLIRQLTDKIQLMQNARQQAIQLTLHPAELGRLSLRLQQESQQLHLQILTESPMAKELIESQLHGLRQQLESQGLQLHQVTIDLHPDWSQAHQQAGQEQGRQPQSGHAGHGPAFSLDSEARDESVTVETILKTNDGSSVNTLA